MRIALLSSLTKSMLASAALILLALSAAPSRAQGDPPFQAGRLSFVSGAVSIQPVGLDDWGQAFANLPIGPGDRIFTDSGGRAEIEVGQTFVRIGPNSDVSFIEDTPTSISIGVAQGSVHVQCLGLWPGQSIHVNTPSGSASTGQPAELRLDVIPDQQAAVFNNVASYWLIWGAAGFKQGLQQGQTLELAGSNPVYPQWLDTAAPDDLDYWSRQRDQQIASAASWRYVSREVVGADELDANGSWTPNTPYGAVWFPNVPGGWAPYHYGHWVNHAPWGSVWVEDESWGYAPFHYGRWVALGGRWGWVPGPAAEHPVWSPALVVFAGGIQVGGVGVSAWFPLGPGEPYRPWYPCSPAYIDRVNISNLRPGPNVHILSTYVGFNFGGIAFSNRSNGITAISQADFAAGRPVRQTNVVINVNIIKNITIIQRPVVEVSTRTIVEHAPARPVPVAAARPAVINEKGLVVSAKPGFKPVAAPVKPAPQVRTLPGHKVVAPPPGASAPPRTATPAQPAHPAPAATQPVKPEVKTAPPAKPVQPAASSPHPATAPATKTTPQPEEKAAPKPAAQPEAKPAPAPAAKPGEKPATKPPVKSDKDKKDEKRENKPEPQ